MSGYIWISKSLFDVSNWRALTSDLAERDKAGAVACGDRNDKGESLGPECFPTVIWPADNARKSDTSKGKDFFYAGTHWIVSGRFAQLMQDFEMGGTHFYPVQFLHADRQTPVGGEWFCLNFGNVKDALLPEKSVGLIQPSVRRAIWRISASIDDHIAFSSAASQGADLWFDARLKQSFCLSARLGDAMIETGIIKGFKGLGELIRARIV